MSDVIAPLVVSDVTSVLITRSSPGLCERQTAGPETKCPTGVSSRTRPPPPRCVSHLIGNVRLWSRRTVGGGSGTMRTGWPGFSSPGPWTDPFLEHRGSDLQIYLQNCVSCVEHVCQSSFFFSKCVLACFFNFYTSIYYSWRHWYISELAETFFCVILCL